MDPIDSYNDEIMSLNSSSSLRFNDSFRADDGTLLGTAPHSLRQSQSSMDDSDLIRHPLSMSLDLSVLRDACEVSKILEEAPLFQPRDFIRAENIAHTAPSSDVGDTHQSEAEILHQMGRELADIQVLSDIMIQNQLKIQRDQSFLFERIKKSKK